MMDDQDTIQQINVLGPEETIRPFLISLQKTILRVELGLSATLPTEETGLPNTILKVAPVNNFKPKLQERRDDFEYWLISNGLRDFAEAFHLFLDDVHTACRWYDLATISPISDEHIQKLIAGPHADFHSLSFPDKVRRLRKLFGIKIAVSALERIRSLNRVRNCYAHRQGVVRVDDTNAGADTLLVKWLGLRYEIAGKRYTLAEKEQKKFPPGATMDILLCPVEKRFSLGDRLSFSTDEFAEFGVTYMMLAKSLVPQLQALAERCFPLVGTSCEPNR